MKIDLHAQLLAWRKEIAVRKLLPQSKRLEIKLAGFVLGDVTLFRWSGLVGAETVVRLPRFWCTIG